MLTPQTQINLSNTESEDALLGALLMEASYGLEPFSKVAAFLEVADFRGVAKGDPPQRWAPNARFYHAMLLCYRQGKAPHQIHVAQKLAELGIMELYDCAQLSHLIAQCPCPLDYMDYARAVKDYSFKRQAKELAGKGDLDGLKRLGNKPKPYKGLHIERR